MNQVVVRGESVYQCDVCTRKVRVPMNRYGLDVLQHCIITQNCKGKLHKVTLRKDINNTPAFAPEVDGLHDWFPRKILYTHTQSIESDTWIIKHELGNKPTIHAFVDIQTTGGVVMLTALDPVTIDVIDIDTVKLTFAKAYSGIAQCVSLTSASTINQSITKTTSVSTAPLQLTNNTADLVFATLDSSTVVDLVLTYQASATTTPNDVDYTNISSVPALTTPWAGTRKVVVNGLKYTVRSINLQTSPNGAVAFEGGLVPSGSTFTVKTLNGTALKQNDMIYLCANSPFATVDRIYDRIIDASMINSTDPETYYDSGKGYCKLSAVRNVYPLILVV